MEQLKVFGADEMYDDESVTQARHETNKTGHVPRVTRGWNTSRWETGQLNMVLLGITRFHTRR